MPTCEVCQKEKAVGVCCVPGVPYSAAYCKTCLEANAHPYGIVVANTACCGGLEHTCQEWQDLVRGTLVHLNKSPDQFKADVDKCIADEPGATAPEEWFNDWYRVEDGQHFYYNPSNERFGPFESKQAAWESCRNNPYEP